MPFAAKKRAMKLGEILVRERELTHQQLHKALQVQGLLGGRLGTTLLEEGMADERAVLEALGRQRSTRTVSAADLAGVPADVVRMVPGRLAERYCVVPFELKGRTLSVASMDAGDLLKEDEIGFLTSCMVRTCIALEHRIFEALERYYRIRSPERHQSLSRRLARKAAEVAHRPRPTPVLSAPATPLPRPRPPAPIQPSGNGAGAMAPPVKPAPRRFIELDAEDAALLGTSASDASEWSPPSDEPVILEPAPLPWLAKETGGGQVAESAPPARPPSSAVETRPASAPVDKAPVPEHAAPVTGPEVEASKAPDVAASGLEERLRRASAELRNAEIRDDIADVLLAFCRPFLARRALLVTRKELIVGWRGEGEGIDPEKLRAIEIPVNDPSVFLGLRSAGSFWLGSLPPLDANQLLIDGLGGVAPGDCLVLPVTLKSRVVCYLYGDNLGSGVAGAPVAELRRLTAKAGLAFQVYILKNKLRML